MENTTNYNLKKPGADDFFDVSHQNDNMDIIDSALKSVNDKTDEKVSKSDYIKLSGFCVAAGSANALAITLEPSPLSYEAGQRFYVKAATANTSDAPTLNVNGLGGKTICRLDGSALAVGELAADNIYELIYDGSAFRLGGSSKFYTDALKSVSVNTTLTAAGWVGTAAPYIQTVTVSGVGVTTNGLVNVSWDISDEAYQVSLKAKLKLSGQSTNTLTIAATGAKPTVDIPIIALILG